MYERPLGRPGIQQRFGQRPHVERRWYAAHLEGCVGEYASHHREGYWVVEVLAGLL